MRIIGLLILALSWTVPCEATLAIIVNPNNPIKAMTANQVKAIFLGQMKNFPSGKQAIPIDQTVNSTARVEFYSKVIRKSEVQLKSYWSGITFTGKAQPPAQGGNDKQVKELIAENPSMLGYINAEEVDDSVKVVLEID